MKTLYKNPKLVFIENKPVIISDDTVVYKDKYVSLETMEMYSSNDQTIYTDINGIDSHIFKKVILTTEQLDDKFIEDIKTSNHELDQKRIAEMFVSWCEKEAMWDKTGSRYYDAKKFIY